MILKKGDQLRCVASTGGITQGRIYNVVHAEPLSILVTVENDRGETDQYYRSRFELVTPIAPPTKPPELFPGDRSEYPVFTGLLMYFPNACAAVARCSHVMNQQHNPGEPVHWDKSKSIGTGDQTVRHLMDSAYGTPPNVVDGKEVEHAANHAWRAMEYLERLILAKRGE